MNARHGFWNMIVALAPPVMAMLVSVSVLLSKQHPLAFLVLPLVLSLAGFSLFLKAKLSLLRAGRLISFGPRLMTPRCRLFYKAGYSLLGLSVALGLLIHLSPGI